MPEKPPKPSGKSKRHSEELGWDFHNEISFTLLEINALREARDKIQSDTEAFDQRLGSLDAIKKFLNRKK